MKKSFLSLLIIPAMLLTGCSFFNRNGANSYKTYAKDISVYNIDKLDEQSNLSSGYQTTIKARFIEDQDLVPYLTLKQYASLYEYHYASDVYNKFSSSLFGEAWAVYKGESPIFMAQFSPMFDEVLYAGSLQAGFKDDDDPRDLKALNFGLEVDTNNKMIGDSTSYVEVDYGAYDLVSFDYKGESYYSLGFLDTTFLDSSLVYFTYNYKHIISTIDVENYSTLKYIDEGNEYTFDSQMESVAKEMEAPSYLVNYNASLFIYLMDNFYGLKKYKDIYSFENYYRNKCPYNIYSALRNASNAEARGCAYSDALSILDDNHTLLVSANKSWGESAYGMMRRYGDGCNNRSRTKSTLRNLRDSAYGSKKIEEDIIYSEDGKTALFSFDSFSFGTTAQVFNTDGSVNLEQAKNYDTYFKLIYMLQSLKAKGGVENVILDISLNGGGTVGVMLKILALISKDNSSNVTMYMDNCGQAEVYNPHVDINDDKLYNTDDCFGDDFNFFILTSDCSFSCGNAFPCAAQRQGSAKIIGQKSGGGECAVSVHYLPNSEYVYHSSNIHIGVLNEEQTEFIGFESGATPDIEIPIGSNFYSIEYLNSAIQNVR